MNIAYNITKEKNALLRSKYTYSQQRQIFLNSCEEILFIHVLLKTIITKRTELLALENNSSTRIKETKETLIKEKEAVALKLKELGVEEELINLKGMTQGMLVILGQKNIKQLSDFADLSSDELIGGFDEIKGKKVRIEGYLEEFTLSREEADQLIMAAREIAYK